MSPTDEEAMRCLGELAELGMAVVRRLSGAIEAAETVDDLASLTDAFCKAGRGVRQCIALRMRIAQGTFPGERPSEPVADAAPTRTERPEGLDTERPEADPPERGDWRERPDWETPERLDAEEVFETDVGTAVLRVRSRYAQAMTVLERVRPGSRAALLGGAAHLRLVDSS